MKLKILAFVLLATLSPGAFAEQWLADRSSRTVGAETLVRIRNSGPGDILYKVMVTSCASVSGSSFSIYDSSGVATSTISLNIPLSTSPYGAGLSGDFSCIRDYEFSIRISSSITYTKQGTGEVVILWKNSSLDREQ